MTRRLRVGVLVSGRGSNLQALIDAADNPTFPAEVVTVISNRVDAYALERAAAAGIRTETIDHGGFASREAFDAEIDRRLHAAGVGLVCLAGFMRVLTPGFVAAWEGRILNIHPSLLPSFPGLHPHAQAIEAGVRVSGCTVHFVTADLDAGPIIVQAAVPVQPHDTADSLAERIIAEEHRCYPLAVRLVAEGRTRIVGPRVEIDGVEAGVGSVLSPRA